MNPAVAASTGETREETLSQGGGVSPSLSGGDEHSEPESLTSSVVAIGGNDSHGEGAASERGGAAPKMAGAGGRNCSTRSM